VSASFVGRSLAQQHAAIAQGRSEAKLPDLSHLLFFFVSFLM
jgi:hypothetical protein